MKSLLEEIAWRVLIIHFKRALENKILTAGDYDCLGKLLFPSRPKGGGQEVGDSDNEINTEKTKAIRNLDSSLSKVPAHFEPLEDPADHRELINILDQRAGTQRGKARSRNPAMNPLGCRLFDMNCGSTMYRASAGKTYRYSCGLYMQSHGQQCANNKVDGPVAVRFGSSCIRQKRSSA